MSRFHNNTQSLGNPNDSIAGQALRRELAAIADREAHGGYAGSSGQAVSSAYNNYHRTVARAHASDQAIRQEYVDSTAWGGDDYVPNSGWGNDNSLAVTGPCLVIFAIILTVFHQWTHFLGFVIWFFQYGVPDLINIFFGALLGIVDFIHNVWKFFH